MTTYPKSLGDVTDFFLLRTNASITKFDEYSVIRTLATPEYYFGNYIYLHNNIMQYQKAYIESIFDKAFTNSKIKHRAFAWPYCKEEIDAINAFVESGYLYTKCTVLRVGENELIKPERMNRVIEIKTFTGEADWQHWYAMEFAERDETQDSSAYSVFLQGQITRFRQLIDQGSGVWYGAYVKGELVGSAGLFWSDRIGRFQEVRTIKTWRDQGVCKTLLYHICLAASRFLDELIIVADDSYHALKLYQTLGFSERGKQVNLLMLKECRSTCK